MSQIGAVIKASLNKIKGSFWLMTLMKILLNTASNSTLFILYIHHNVNASSLMLRN